MYCKCLSYSPMLPSPLPSLQLAKFPCQVPLTPTMASVTNRKNGDDDTAHDSANRREDWEVQRDAYKATGDDAFRCGNFTEAISFYTHALDLDPTHFVLLSNRSAAHLKAGHKSKSLQDALTCVEVNPKFAKGYSRLAAAQQSLGRWQVAKETYEKLLALDPANTAVAKKGLEDCQSKLQEQQEQEAGNEKTNFESKPAVAKDEDDLLDDFFSEVETVVTKKAESLVADEKGPKEISIQKKDLGTAAEQIERLLAPNYQWRNLNPFYVLDMSHESTEDDISRRYKALSLLLHPDKCRNLERAKEAYDEVQRAKAMLNNEDKARHVRGLVERGMKLGKQVWKEKGPTAKSLAEVQSKEVQRIFAQIELKRREVEKNERKHEQRERQQEEEELEKERLERKFDKNWRDETRVDKRIGNWRDFQQKKKPKI